MSKADKTRVFLSYAHEDLDMVRRIYTGLKERNLDVWFDKEDLGPGLWKRKIEKAIPKSRFFIICISEAALKKTGDEPGFQDEELQQAYEIARVQSEDAFTIVPIRLEDCGRGDHRLSTYQQYDLLKDFESELDHLAIKLGGISLADRLAKDKRTEDEMIVESLMGKAETFFYASDYEKELETYNYVITLDPGHFEAWINKGVLLRVLDREEEALEAFNIALEIQPASFFAWELKGTTFFSIGRPEEALTSYVKALEIKPDFEVAWSNRGGALAALGRHVEALSACESALEIMPDLAQAWNNKGAALYALGRKEEASSAYQKALEIQPDYADNRYSKSFVLLDLGRKEKALAASNKTLEIQPD